MKTLVQHLKIPALAGAALVLPFILMEAANRRAYGEGFPVMVFAALWILPALFTLGLAPLRRTAGGEKVFARPLGAGLRVLLLVFIAVVWAAIVADQLPCFLGAPYCD